MFKKAIARAIPHIAAVIIFALVGIIYFYPNLEGYELNQSDSDHWVGMSKEILDFREKFDEEPLWTNSMFGGMPAYQISTTSPNLISMAKDFLIGQIPRPICYMFLLFIGFYIMMLCFSADPWTAIIGALAFGLASFNILYIGSGHMTKVHALSFIPPIIGSLFYGYRRNHITASILLSIFLCLHLGANHLQMTYYLLFFIAAIVLLEFYLHLKQKMLAKFFKVSAVLLIAATLGILPTLSNLIITEEYGKYTTRGKSDLTITPGKVNELASNDALGSEYITRYNLGYGETWSLLIPNVKGGTVGKMSTNKKAMNLVNKAYTAKVGDQPSYWGEQLTSGGSFYYGATIFLLFLLGMFFVKDKIKWVFLAIAILSILLSWKHSVIVEFFIKYFPLFNKFRDTKMILVLIQISFPLLGILFVNHILKEKIKPKKFIIITSGLLLILLLFLSLPTVFFDFLSKKETETVATQISTAAPNVDLKQTQLIQDELIKVRVYIFRQDVIRSLIFILITGIVLLLFIFGKIRKILLFAFLGILVVIDMYTVDKRYLNNDKKGKAYIRWIDTEKHENPFEATVADNEILKMEMQLSPALKKQVDSALALIKQEKGVSPREFKIMQEKESFCLLNLATDYRVFALKDPFINTKTSYHHKSIGGYHGAKLKKFQELTDFYIYNEYSNFVKLTNQRITYNELYQFMNKEMPVLNMMNTKYIIRDPAQPPFVNPYCYGNVWFVDEVTFVDSANQEMRELKNLKKSWANVNNQFKHLVPETLVHDSTATITLLSYKANQLIYKTKTGTEQLAVFSEIYYADGWNAYLDGTKTDYLRANYLLRAMKVPAGEHTIEFKFEPQSYAISTAISEVGSVLLLLFALGMGFVEFRKRRQEIKKVG